jgi:hypothetical protein
LLLSEGKDLKKNDSATETTTAAVMSGGNSCWKVSEFVNKITVHTTLQQSRRRFEASTVEVVLRL